MNLSVQYSKAGMQSSIRLHEAAAVRIAHSTSTSSEIGATDSTPLNSATHGDDLTNAIVDMKISEKGYSANAKVIKVQDRMMGALLDIVG